MNGLLFSWRKRDGDGALLGNCLVQSFPQANLGKTEDRPLLDALSEWKEQRDKLGVSINTLALNLSKLTRLTSSDIGQLIMLNSAVKTDGCRLELINLRPEIWKIMEITRLISLFAKVETAGDSNPDDTDLE